jgi:mono/diheme cytochrome c family protein
MIAVLAPVLLCAGSTRDGVFTPEQAERGSTSYAKACASCHRANLAGKGAALPLAGSGFLSNWDGQTVGDLFDKIQTSMPADRPGKLSRPENADILAFILSVNKFPAGKTELPSEAKSLEQIRFEAPQASK